MLFVFCVKEMVKDGGGIVTSGGGWTLEMVDLNRVRVGAEKRM